MNAPAEASDGAGRSALDGLSGLLEGVRSAMAGEQVGEGLGWFELDPASMRIASIADVSREDGSSEGVESAAGEEPPLDGEGPGAVEGSWFSFYAARKERACAPSDTCHISIEDVEQEGGFSGGIDPATGAGRPSDGKKSKPVEESWFDFLSGLKMRVSSPSDACHVSIEDVHQEEGPFDGKGTEAVQKSWLDFGAGIKRRIAATDDMCHISIEDVARDDDGRKRTPAAEPPFGGKGPGAAGKDWLDLGAGIGRRVFAPGSACHVSVEDVAHEVDGRDDAAREVGRETDEGEGGTRLGGGGGEAREEIPSDRRRDAAEDALDRSRDMHY